MQRAWSLPRPSGPAVPLWAMESRSATGVRPPRLRCELCPRNIYVVLASEGLDWKGEGQSDARGGCCPVRGKFKHKVSFLGCHFNWLEWILLPLSPLVCVANSSPPSARGTSVKPSSAPGSELGHILPLPIPCGLPFAHSPDGVALGMGYGKNKRFLDLWPR